MRAASHPTSPVALVCLLLGAVPALTACRTPEPPPAPAPIPVFPDEWRVVDLTRPLDRDTPHLSHPDSFPFERIEFADAADGRHVAAWSAIGLMGTHVESPAIFGGPGMRIERIPVQHLTLPAVVLDAPPVLEALDGADAAAVGAVGISAILAYESRHGRIERDSIVLLRTGDGDVPSADLNLAGHVPPGGYRHRGWSEDAVRFLAGERAVRAIGTDAITVDPGDRVDESPAARAAATLGLYTVSNLAGLGPLPRRGAVLVVAALPIRGALAAQARVLAFVPPPPPPSHLRAGSGTESRTGAGAP